MQRIETIIIEAAVNAIRILWETEINSTVIQIQKTRREFEGDFTLVVFPLLKISKHSPEQTAIAIGEYCIENSEILESFNVIKGFLNISVSPQYWINLLTTTFQNSDYNTGATTEDPSRVMVEFSSPNTNKPLHLGHIRNNLLGYSISKIMEANGNQVRKVNLVNDRGIHICKSMIAWQQFGDGETPESGDIKGDHLVGKYYVKYNEVYKTQVSELISHGADTEAAAEQAPILLGTRRCSKNGRQTTRK